MVYKNKQITIRIPDTLESKIKNKAWEDKISRNKVIENILLKAFDLPEELPPVMSNVIWHRLTNFEVKLKEAIKRIKIFNSAQN